MSEPTTSTAGKPPGKKILGMNRTTVIIFAVALVGAGAWFLWKKHQASTAAAATSTTTPTTDTSGTGTDDSGDLSAIQSELEQLLASEGTAGAGAGSAGGGGTTTTTPVTTPVASGPPASTTPTTSTGSTATATTAKTAGAISNLQATSVGKTTAKVSWNKAANATGYSYRVTQMNGKLIKSGETTATSVSLSGLTSKYEYNFGVQALPGGPGDNIHFTTS
jgi:hypothetical protein